LQGVNALAYNMVVPSTLAAAAGDQVKVRVQQQQQTGHTLLLRAIVTTA
jgi:hypothetical protein